MCALQSAASHKMYKVSGNCALLNLLGLLEHEKKFGHRASGLLLKSIRVLFDFQFMAQGPVVRKPVNMIKSY